jgi:hypothetical protein
LEKGRKNFEVCAAVGVAASRKFNPYVFVGDSRGADNS